MAASVAESLPMPVILCKIRPLPGWIVSAAFPESYHEAAHWDHTIPDPALNLPHPTVTTPLAIVDQFILNKMAQAMLPEVRVVQCWKRHFKGLLLILLHRCDVMYNLGDVISRDPHTGKAIDWCHISSS